MVWGLRIRIISALIKHVVRWTASSPQNLNNTCCSEPPNLCFNKASDNSEAQQSLWTSDLRTVNVKGYAHPAIQLPWWSPGPPPFSRCGISPELLHDLPKITLLIGRRENILKEASWLQNQDVPRGTSEWAYEWHKLGAYSYEGTVKNSLKTEQPLSNNLQISVYHHMSKGSVKDFLDLTWRLQAELLISHSVLRHSTGHILILFPWSIMSHWS